jgi:hypothetical protein
MTGIKPFHALGIAAIAGVLAAPAAANPPFEKSSYDFLAGGAVIGKAVVGAGGDKPGATLAAGSYIDADCASGSTKLFTAHVDLTGTPINNPAGVINASPAATKQPANSPGTLSTRFFIRWFPSVSSAPSGAPTQGPPTGAPGSGQGATGSGQGAAGPAPGDTGSGSFSGRNSPASHTAGGFCSFSLSFVAQKAR